MLRLLAALVLAAGPGVGPAGAVAASGRDVGPPGGSVVFRFSDPAIAESSGLVVEGSGARRLFVTTNDSGDTGRVFAVDPTSGDTVGVTTWSAAPVDVEALAPAGPGQVWVGDIGDNGAERPSVSVTRVPIGRGSVSAASAPTYELVYPRGPRDAETLLVDPDGRLLVVTKGLLGGEFLRADARLDPDRPNAMRSVGVALPIATDGAFFPDGRHLVVRSYGSAVVYAYPSLDEVGSVRLPEQQQGEGIAVDRSGSVFVSSEGAHAPVLRVRLPRALRRAVAPPPPSTGASEATADDAPPATAQADDETADAEAAYDDLPTWAWAAGGVAVLVLGIGSWALLRRRRPGG